MVPSRISDYAYLSNACMCATPPPLLRSAPLLNVNVASFWYSAGAGCDYNIDCCLAHHTPCYGGFWSIQLMQCTELWRSSYAQSVKWFPRMQPSATLLVGYSFKRNGMGFTFNHAHELLSNFIRYTTVFISKICWRLAWQCEIAFTAILLFYLILSIF